MRYLNLDSLMIIVAISLVGLNTIVAFTKSSWSLEFCESLETNMEDVYESLTGGQCQLRPLQLVGDATSHSPINMGDDPIDIVEDIS